MQRKGPTAKDDVQELFRVEQQKHLHLLWPPVPAVTKISNGAAF